MHASGCAQLLESRPIQRGIHASRSASDDPAACLKRKDAIVKHVCLAQYHSRLPADIIGISMPLFVRHAISALFTIMLLCFSPRRVFRNDEMLARYAQRVSSS
ncbi:hypothetical protein AcV5_005953 [Taiwanofungus camphoratus]|nr:hypothetical protein AcV5_005953 [Antrodia cinnamomea]KAI0948262.1 hypothetical protein AcV7_009064 [Antrodia cinnamomea]